MRKQALVSISAAFAVGVCAVSAVSAQAQSYKADDIIKHFGGGKPNLGVSRGLCVGTEAECSKAGHVVKPAAAFDLVVRFKYNSDVLEPDAKSNLDEFAKALKDPQLAASSFLVEGHTDARGSADYNLNLSERRAKAVVSYLSERGVDTAKLLPRGFGQTKPIVADPYSGDNRRVETRIRVD
ncbi:OmpA family protein [Bosea sp. (in: a-proteobacteria)]|uniref:OmpA family protein n=1 Tax=Bosea sp. (in: a-proteobacteria) TaxID=1871050 RepID=UPI0025BDC3BD|nr:OmpA family protein [Bosea sp. (in: a-proteobacteria)]